MKKILLGVTASIAAYRAQELARMLVKAGYSVHTILTENSLHLVAPLTFETLTGNPVHTASFPGVSGWAGGMGGMEHIRLKEGASLLLVAPATADIIGKFACGIADDLLSTTFLSVLCPVVMAPAMNPNMYGHPALKANMERLRSWGVTFVDPAEGAAVCGDEGYGKLAGLDDIFRAVQDAVR